MQTSVFRMVQTFTALGASLVLLTAGVQPAAAEPAEEEGSVQELQNRVKELEDSVDRLNREGRTLQNAIDSQKPIAGWQNGFNLASPDGAYKLKITGYTHADGRFFIEDDDKGDINRFLFRRVRVSLEGTVARYFDFRIMAGDVGPVRQAKPGEGGSRCRESERRKPSDGTQRVTNPARQSWSAAETECCAGGRQLPA
jgi:hypothetical protein